MPMNQFSHKTYYRRNLPHFQPEGATLFITFRLSNSLPHEVVGRLQVEKDLAEKRINLMIDTSEREKEQLKEQYRLFDLWENALASVACGEKYLSNPRIAELVAESMHYRDGSVYYLEAFCIMPNHVHLVCTPLIGPGGMVYTLSKIMHSLKRHTARKANQILGREGAFWQHENYDHYIRDAADLERIIEYVLLNPVKAGLVDDWTHWKWFFCKRNP